MKKIVLAAAVAAAAWSCSNPAAYTIRGEVEGVEGTVYLVDAATMESVDSVEAAGGRFRFEGVAEIPFAAVIHTDEMEAQPFFANLIVEPGTVRLTGERNAPHGVTAAGTPSNDGVANYNELRRKTLDRYYAEGISDEERTAIEERYDATVDSLLEANRGNLFGAILLAQERSYGMPAAELIAEIDRFPEAVRSSSMLAELRRQAEAKARTEVGQPYIDVAQPDASGETVTLKSVVENPANRYVLLDFWASWCNPCMGEVPYLVEAYGKYHKKGFEIYGVSFDRERAPWVEAVGKNRMAWIQVSELLYFDNAAAEAYAVRGIPSNFLIDCSTGKIVATQLRGEAVAEKLAELLD